MLRGVQENEQVYVCQPVLMGSSQAQNQEGGVQKVEVRMNYLGGGIEISPGLISWLEIRKARAQLTLPSKGFVQSQMLLGSVR